MIEMPKLKLNSTITVQKKVEESDTGLNYGSGGITELLATPSLIALMIEGSVKLIDDKLPEDFVSVGAKVMMNHEKATLLGETISVRVELAEQEGNKVVIKMVAFDEVGEIGRGEHTRYILNKQGLIEKATKRASKLESINY